MPEQNPWQKPEGPPDLFSLMSRLFKRATQSGDGQGDEGSSSWIWWVVGIIFALWTLSGIFIVNQAEEAVVLRFGRFVRTVGPGPHWLPSIIENHRTVDVQQIRNFQYQSEMLTRDENIVNVSLAVQFRVDAPRNYLFNVINPEQSLKQATASALRQIVGQMTLDAILTTGRASLRDRVSTQLKQTVAAYDMGIEVTDVRLLPARPPEAVTEAFDDAIKAREDEQSYINQGEAYARKVISEVQGQSAKLIQSAEGYQQQVVLQAKGDVARYNALLKPYLASPTVTKERLYMETMQSILSHTRNVVVDAGAHNLMYLPLDKLSQLSSVSGHNTSVDTDESSPSSLSLPSPLVAGVSQHYGASRPSYSRSTSEDQS